jgi:PAS domain S-box-containing protein
VAGPAESRKGTPFVVAALAIATGIAVLDAALGSGTILTATFVAPPMVAAVGAGPRSTARVLVLAVALALLSGVINHEFGSVDHLTGMLPVLLGGGLAVYVALLRSQREQTAVRLDTQYAVARTFSEAGSLEEAIPRLLGAIGARHGWELGGYWTREAGHSLGFVGSWSAPGVDVASYDKVCRELAARGGFGLPGKVLDAGMAVWIADVLASEHFQRTEVGERLGLRGFVGFPITRHGEIVAVMEFFARSVREPEPDQLALLEALGSQIGGYVDSLRTDEAMRASEALKRAVVDSALDCVITIDHRGLVTGFNPAAQRTFGYSEADAVGRELAELVIPPSLREAHRAALRRYLETEQATILDRRLELTGMRSDGSVFPVELAVSRIPGSSPPAFTGYLRDISERQRAEREREAARAQLEAILSGVADGVTAQAPDGTLLFANDAALHVLGYQSSEELLNTPLTRIMDRFEVYDEHGRPFPLDRLPGRRALAGEHGAEELLRFRVQATDEDHWSIVKATPVTDDEGNVLMAINVFEDITEHKLSERQQAFLAESSGLLAASLDADETLRKVAWLAVPEIADWCAVDLAADNGGLERVALVHADPERLARAEELQRRYPPDPNSDTGVPKVLRTGEPELWPEITDEFLLQAVEDPEQLELLREIGLRSALVVPMIVHDRPIGALTFVNGASGRRFSEEDLPMAQELARRCATAIDNARVYTERDYIARTLQNSLLPSELPTIPGLETAARFHATGEGNEVGGDFYDLFQTGQRGWGLAVGDVCGKGPDAAAVTALARYTLRAAAMRERLPSRVLGVLNEALLRRAGERTFCTVAYAYLEADDGRARLGFASGGHPLPLLLRNDGGGVEWLGQHGMLLGAVSDPTLEDRSVDLAPGDSVVFYTDGVTEAGSPRHALGEERLAEVVAGCKGMSADRIAGSVEAAAIGAEDGAPRDDIAVVVVRVADGAHHDGSSNGQ